MFFFSSKSKVFLIVVKTHWFKIALLQYVFDLVSLLILELITHFVDSQVVLDMNFDKISTLVPASSERVCGESPRALLSRKISSKYVKDEIFPNSDGFALREEELNRREKLIHERELKLERNSADYYDKRRSESHVNIERPQWVTLDECMSANTSQWDSWSSVSDFKTNVKNVATLSANEKQTDGDGYRRRECENSSMRRNSEVGVPQLIDALYSMTSSVNQRNSRPLAKEDRFSGDPVKYRRFIKQFETYVVRGIHNSADKLDLLISSCTGEARENIADCILASSSEIGYLEARRILEINYGQSHIIVDAYVKTVTEGPSLRTGDVQSLSHLARAMRNCLITCSGLSSAGLDTQQTIGSVFKRLPKDLQDKFMSEFSTKLERNELVTFKDLTEFVERRSRMGKSYLGQLTLGKGERRQERAFVFDQSRKRTYFTSAGRKETKDVAPKTPQCSECKGFHTLWRCRLFQEKTVKERWEIVKNHQLCFNCFGTHVARNCRSNGRCKRCNRRHHTLLHVPDEEYVAPRQRGACVNGAGAHSAKVEESSRTEDKQKGICASGKANCSESGKVWLKVVPVTVWGPSCRKRVTTYAFLDEGSDTTLCSQRLVDQLRLQGTKVSFSLASINGVEEQNGVKVDLNMCGIRGTDILSLRDVVAVSTLPDLTDNIPDKEDVGRFPNLLRNAEFTYLPQKTVDLLIGADHQLVHRPLEYRFGQTGNPDAIRTQIGWTLIGQEINFRSHNLLHVNYVQRESIRLSEQLQQIYDTDFVTRNSGEPPSSTEDRRALKIMEESAVKVDGHYQIALPWKSDDRKLPNNRQMAERRLNSVKQRFVRNPEFFQVYCEKLADYISNGYARMIPKIVWFQEHAFGIYHTMLLRESFE